MTDQSIAEICDALRNRLTVPESQTGVGLDWDQIAFMLDLILNQTAPGRKIDTLEIGLGIGCSAGAFLLSGRSRRHTVISMDGPERRDLALKNVRQFDGDGIFELREESSHLALPKLVADGAKFDIALIDGGHRFDEIFIDFHYVRSLLNPSGFVLLDDLWMASTKSVVSWIETNLEAEWDRLPNVPKNFAAFQKRDIPDKRTWYDFTPFDTSWASAEPGRSLIVRGRMDRTVAAISRFCRRIYVRIRPRTTN